MQKEPQAQQFFPPAAMLLEVCAESIDLRRSEGTIRLRNEIGQFALDEFNFILERQRLGNSATSQLRSGEQHICS